MARLTFRSLFVLATANYPKESETFFGMQRKMSR